MRDACKHLERSEKNEAADLPLSIGFQSVEIGRHKSGLCIGIGASAEPHPAQVFEGAPKTCLVKFYTHRIKNQRFPRERERRF
jgi:hypothetical protein